ncbi:unnamed protein product [Trichobilharzia szidati]|nr:unnamed protein product [Trichobilharzia szidati]
MSIRRATDPVYLQFIWNAIEACTRDSIESTFHELLSFIQRECESKCTAGKLQSELSNAISDGCIECNQRCYVKCDNTPKNKDKHDWYCFECHGPGHVVACPTCFRVYHPDCLPIAMADQLSFRIPSEDGDPLKNGSNNHDSSSYPPTHPCPVCQRVSRAASASSTSSSKIPTTASELHKIFQVVLDRIRNKVNWKTMQVVGYLNEPLRNQYLVYRQINTRLMMERMRTDPTFATTTKDAYPNRTALLVDADLLIHNTAIFYGNKNDMSNMARQIRSQLERELRESSFCVDCYLRFHSSAAMNKLTAPCRTAHRLLWFQHNGWSFRPCKMLYESAEGYEVVCFGGRHERVFVPLSRAFDMSFTADELGLRETPPLKKALNEAEEYKANQALFDRQLMKGYPDHPLSNGKSLSETMMLMNSMKNNHNDHNQNSVMNSGPEVGFFKNATNTNTNSTTTTNSSETPRKRRPGRRPKGYKPAEKNPPVSCSVTTVNSTNTTTTTTSRRDVQWSETLKNMNEEDNLTSLSSLDSDSDDRDHYQHRKRKSRLSGHPATTTDVSSNVNKSPAKLSTPHHYLATTTTPTPTTTTTTATTAKRKSYKRKRNDADDIFPSRGNFPNGSGTTTPPPPSCDDSDSSSSDELSLSPTPLSFSSKKTSKKTIRIKPLPIRNQNGSTTTVVADVEDGDDISFSLKETKTSLLPRLTCVDGHVVRSEPLHHSMSSASSAASGPSSSDRTTIPAVASSSASGGGSRSHTPPESSVFSSNTSSTYSNVTTVKRSRGRPPKSATTAAAAAAARLSKLSASTAKVESSTPSGPPPTQTSNDSASSTRLVLSTNRNVYECSVRNKHSPLTNPIHSSGRQHPSDSDIGSCGGKQLPARSLSPVQPSCLSDAESDSLSLSSSSDASSSASSSSSSSSVSTPSSSTSSQLSSSSSLSSTSTPSRQSLSYSTSLKSKIMDQEVLSVTNNNRAKQKLSSLSSASVSASKDIPNPLRNQVLATTTTGYKETVKQSGDNISHNVAAVPKLTKSMKSSRHHSETKLHGRLSSRAVNNDVLVSDNVYQDDVDDDEIGFTMASPDNKCPKSDKLNPTLRHSTDGMHTLNNRSVISNSSSSSTSAPNSSVKTYHHDNLMNNHNHSKLNTKLTHPSNWSTGGGGSIKLLSSMNDQLPSTTGGHLGHHHHHPTMNAVAGGAANTSVGPTPPLPSSSNSSAASSCYSSVSPAALSSTSGLGSSLSDPKSVDASPGGEVANMLGGGNASFSSGSGNGATGGSLIHLQTDSNSGISSNIMMKTEERIHRIYADRLIALTTERDQAREEVHRRDILISELRRSHEAEIKRIKQRTWCQVCLNEAFYHCCPGTAYCSETCQLEHWTAQHNRDCRRRTESQQQQQQQMRS